MTKTDRVLLYVSIALIISLLALVVASAVVLGLTIAGTDTDGLVRVHPEATLLGPPIPRPDPPYPVPRPTPTPPAYPAPPVHVEGVRDG